MLEMGISAFGRGWSDKGLYDVGEMRGSKNWVVEKGMEMKVLESHNCIMGYPIVDWLID